MLLASLFAFFSTNQNAESLIEQSQFSERLHKIGKLVCLDQPFTYI